MQFYYNCFYRVEKSCLLSWLPRCKKTLKANCLTGCLYYIVLEPFLYHWDRAIFYKYMTIEKWWTCNWLHFIAVSKKKFFRSLEIQSSYKNLIKIKNILCRAIISVSFLKMDFEVPKNYIIFFFCVGNSDWIVFSCHKLAIFFHKVGACHNSQRGVAKKQRYLSHTDDTVWICLALSKAS